MKHERDARLITSFPFVLLCVISIMVVRELAKFWAPVRFWYNALLNLLYEIKETAKLCGTKLGLAQIADIEIN